MAKKFVAALIDEIAVLESDLNNDPRFIKLQELKRLRGLYASDAAGLGGVGADRTSVIETVVARPVRRRLPGSVRKRLDRNKIILQVAADIIRGRTEPTSTGELLEYLEKEDVTVHGQSPRNTLSAVLSKSDKFYSHGRSGWTLSDPTNAENTNKGTGEQVLYVQSSVPFSRVRDDQPDNPSVRPVDPVPGGGT